MKDPHSVLREKEQDLARVRREIQALLTVIPLLEDDQTSSEVMHKALSALSRAPVDLPDNDMAQLEIYYPFVRHLRISERAIPRVLSGDDLCRSPGRNESGEQESWVSLARPPVPLALSSSLWPTSQVQPCGPVFRLLVLPACTSACLASHR
jgi:hypothetical protein